MSLVPAILAGGALGLRHALESDHLAAVTTMGRTAEGRPGRVGVWWGLGHGVPVAVVGLGVLFLGVEVPEVVTRAAEAVAGLLLIALGAWTLVDVFAPGVRRHAHGDRVHGHLALGGHLLGTRHQHVDPPAFAVGVVHGLAGSGAVVVVLVATSPTWATGIVFVGAFVTATIATMAAISAVWCEAGGTAWHRPLRTGAGILAVAIGLQMVASHLPGFGWF